MSTPRRLWIDKTGQPVITTTANGERNARRWGWTPARAVPSDPAPAPSVVPEAAVEAAAQALRAHGGWVPDDLPDDEMGCCAEEVARAIPVDVLAALVAGCGASFETGQWRVELAFPLSEPVSVNSWRQDLIDAITPKEADR